MIESEQVERLPSLSRESFLADHLQRSQPVVVTGQMGDWSAIGKWGLDLFEQHGTRQVEVEHYPSGNRCDAFSYTQMSLSDYIRRVRAEPGQQSRYYLAELPVGGVIPTAAGHEPNSPPSLDDIRAPEFLPDEARCCPMVFMGVNTFSTAHYHRLRSQAMLCQVVGTKRVRLVPPSSVKKMRLWPWYSMRANHSRLRLHESAEGDISQFPNISEVESYECELSAGEMLFIPDHWMHLVQGVSENITVTYFWDGPWRYANFRGVMRDSAAGASKSLLVAGASVSSRLGTNRLFLNLACKLGVMGSNDRNAIERHLSRFGANRPYEVRESRG